MTIIELRAEAGVSSVFGYSILVSLLMAILGCAAVERNRIQSEFHACMMPLDRESQYAPARAILDPEGGITPSMLANRSHPSDEDLVLFAEYLDAKTRCERRLVEETGGAVHNDKEAFYVMRKQYRARWRSFANFLFGSMTYGEFFAEQESIREGQDDQIAEIERRRKYAAEERKASVENALSISYMASTVNYKRTRLMTN